MVNFVVNFVGMVNFVGIGQQDICNSTLMGLHGLRALSKKESRKLPEFRIISLLQSSTYNLIWILLFGLSMFSFQLKNGMLMIYNFFPEMHGKFLAASRSVFSWSFSGADVSPSFGPPRITCTPTRCEFSPHPTCLPSSPRTRPLSSSSPGRFCTNALKEQRQEFFQKTQKHQNIKINKIITVFVQINAHLKISPHSK